MSTDGLIMPLDLARFVVAYVLIVALPGYALSTVLRPSAPRLERLAFAVPCACSVVAVYGLATTLLHIPLTLGAYVAICVVILLLGVASTRRRTALRARQTQGTLPLGLAATAGHTLRTEAPPPTIDRWWVAPAAVALLEGIVALVIHAGDVVPAAVDVLSHAVWTQSIMREHVFPIALLSSQISSGNGGFYPPVFHALTALVASAASVPAYRAVFYSAVMAATLVPLALFTFVRYMTGRSRLAGLATIASLAFEPLPSWTLAQGLYPFILSCLFIPAIVVALGDGLGRGQGRSVVLAALLGVGLFYTHPTEFLTVLLLTLTIGPVLVARGHSWLRRCLYGLAIAAVWGLAAVPALAAVHRTMVTGAQSEIRSRHDFVAMAHAGPGNLLADYLYGIYARNVSYILFAIATVGLVWCLARRRYIGLVIAQTLLLAIFVDSSTTNLLRPFYVLSFPWALMERLAPTHYWVVLLLAALGLDAVIRHARRLRWARDRLLVALLATPLVWLGLLLPVDVAARHALAYSDARRMMAPADLGAMAWLARHATRTSVVVDDEDKAHPELFDVAIDAGRWLPLLGGGSPLFGQGGSGPGPLEDRLYLLQHIADVPLPTRAARFIARYHVEYVFYGAGVPPRATRHLNLKLLLADPHLRLVYASAPPCRPSGRHGTAACSAAGSYIFAVDYPGKQK